MYAIIYCTRGGYRALHRVFRKKGQADEVCEGFKISHKCKAFVIFFDVPV